jgi:hypothetical protein
MLCLFVALPGCELPKPDAAMPVNFNVTWQIGIVIVLAYLANSKSQLSSVATLGLNVLRGLRILPAADSKVSLDAEDVAKKLAELYVQLQGHPEVQAGILQLMNPAPPQVERATKTK